MTFTCTSAAGPEHAIFSTRKLLFVCVCVFFCLKPHHSLTLATMHYSSLSYEVRYTHPSLFSRFLMEDPLVQCCDAPWRSQLSCDDIIHFWILRGPHHWTFNMKYPWHVDTIPQWGFKVIFFFQPKVPGQPRLRESGLNDVEITVVTSRLGKKFLWETAADE